MANPSNSKIREYSEPKKSSTGTKSDGKAGTSPRPKGSSTASSKSKSKSSSFSARSDMDARSVLARFADELRFGSRGPDSATGGASRPASSARPTAGVGFGLGQAAGLFGRASNTNRSNPLDGVEQRAASRRSPGVNTNTFGDILAMISGALPQQEQMKANLVDMGQALAPYAQARQAVNTQRDTNRGALDQLAAYGQADTLRTIAADRARILGEVQASQAAQQQEGAQQRQDAVASVRDLQAQGVDPSLIAQQQAIASQAVGDVNANRQAQQSLLAGTKAELEQDAARRGNDLKETDRGATTQLNNAVLQAMLGIGQKEAGTRADVTQQNAGALNEAARYNAGLQRQQLEDRVGLAGSLRDTIGQAGGFYTPERQAVQDEIAQHKSTYGGPTADILQRALDQASTPEEAMSQLGTEFKAYNKDKTDWNVPWYADKIKRYFKTDQSKVNADVSRQVLDQYMAGLK